MTLSEWWAEWESKGANQGEQFAGKLTQSDVDELLEWTKNGAT